MRNASPAGVRNGARCSRVRSRLLSNAALSPTPAPAQITYMHPNHGPHDHAPHLPGRRTTYLEYQHVEVVPQLELAPLLAAANVAAVAPPPITPPGAPGPKPSHALHSRRAERRVIRTPWRAADRRGARVRARRRSALSESASRRAATLSSSHIDPRSLS